MKKLLILSALLAALCAQAFAQGGQATYIHYGATLPSGAPQWSIASKIDGTGIYQCTNSPTCTSAGQWVSIGTTTGSGTVTSVGAAATGIFSITGGPIVGSGTLTLNQAGTSGGVPYFSSASLLASSAVLGSGQFVLGGGTGAAPSTSFSIVPVLNGGTGTASPSLVAGSNVTITGSWPNQTVASTGGGGGLSGMTAGQVAIAATATTVTSSEALAGAGAGITTGPVSGTTAGHLVSEVGTTGQIQDSGLVAANQVNASSPGLGIAHFAGSTQTLTSSLIAIADLSASGTASSSTYLRGDNTWATVAAGGLSGMTAGQVAIAATATTVTSSEALAGAGAGITTGPISGTTAGHLVSEVGTTGQIQDSGLVAAIQVNASSPGLGIAHFAGSTQTLTSSLIAIADLSASGTASSTTFLRGDNTWATPAGGGTVTGSSLTLNQLIFGGGSTAIAVGDLSGDVTTSGGKATTVAKLQGNTLTLSSPAQGQVTVFNSSGVLVNAYGGVTVDPQTGNYTYANSACPTDRLGEIEFNISTPATLTVPQAGSTACLGNSNAFIVRNTASSTAVLTVSLTTSTFQPEGGSSHTVLPNSALVVYTDATTSTGNYHAYLVPVGIAGVLVKTTAYTATAGDANKVIVMNCTAACAFTLPAAPPNSVWDTEGILSIGSTLATVSLNGLNLNGSATAPTLTTGHVLKCCNTDGSNYFGDLSSASAGGVTATNALGVVGNSSTTVTPTPALVYVSRQSGADYCAQVNNAFGSTNATNGAVVMGDIQGPVHCSAANANLMMSQCVGGYLQMQDTQVAVDFVGGTPSISIPNKCGGIHGMGSRADKGGAGSSINWCTAVNTPVSGCAAPILRSFPINSITTSGNYLGINVTATANGISNPVVGGELFQVYNSNVAPITAWSINGSNVATFTAANTLVSGEQVILEAFYPSTFFNFQTVTVLSAGLSGSQFEANFTHGTGSGTENGLANPVDNNMYRVCQKNSGGAQPVLNDGSCTANAGTASTTNTFYVVNPNGTTHSSGNGTGYACTHMIFFGSYSSPAFSFGETLQDLNLDGGAIEGGCGIGEWNGEEQSYWRNIKLANFQMTGLDVHTTNSQNHGPDGTVEIYPSASAHQSTIGAFWADATIAQTNKITVAANGITSPSPCSIGVGGHQCDMNVGFLIEENNSIFTGLHCESCIVSYAVGRDIGAQGDTFIDDGGPPSANPGLTVLDISSNFCGIGSGATSDISIMGMKENTGATNVINDHCIPTIITDSYVGFYSWDLNGALLNFLTTSTHQPNELDSGLNIFQSGVVSFEAPGGTAVNLTSPSTNRLNLGSNASLTNAGALTVVSCAGCAAFPVTVTGGVSGAIPYFSSTTVESVSALLAAGHVLLGGGAGAAPTSDTNLDDGVTTANTLTYTGVGGETFPPVAFASLPASPSNGTQISCTDCNPSCSASTVNLEPGAPIVQGTVMCQYEAGTWGGVNLVTGQAGGTTFPNIDQSLTDWSVDTLHSQTGGSEDPASDIFAINTGAPCTDVTCMKYSETTNANTGQTNILATFKTHDSAAQADAVLSQTFTTSVYNPGNWGSASALEFDQFIFSDPLHLDTNWMFGTQCNGGFWDVYSQGGGTWVATNIVCSLLNNTIGWHTVSEGVHRLANDAPYPNGACTGGQPCMYFDWITVDGVKHVVPAAYTPQPAGTINSGWGNFGGDTGVQFQIDIATTGTAKTVTEYLDQTNYTEYTSGNAILNMQDSGTQITSLEPLILPTGFDSAVSLNMQNMSSSTGFWAPATNMFGWAVSGADTAAFGPDGVRVTQGNCYIFTTSTGFPGIGGPSLCSPSSGTLEVSTVAPSTSTPNALGTLLAAVGTFSTSVSGAVLDLPGATSGTATLTPPAIAGTASNPVVSSNYLSMPGLIINGGTAITSASSANSQAVTCPTGGSGTQVCDAAGAWITGPSTTIAFPVTVTGGVSGAIPFFSSTTVEGVSALLAANMPILGGGAGSPPVSDNLNYAAQTDGATVTWAIGSAPYSNASLTFTVHSGSRTLNITNPVNGGQYVIWLKQDGTGGEGLTLGTGCTWKVSGGGAGAVTLSSAAGAIDILAFSYDGTNCYATLTKNFS